MKFFVFVAISLSSLAFASNDYILLKTSGGGMASPEHARSQTCKLFSGASENSYTMVIEEKFGGVLAKESIDLFISDLDRTIYLSTSEPVVKKPNYLCDAPTSSYLAIDSAGKIVDLFQSGGCGSPRIKRQGIASAQLRMLLDRYCPITHDYGI